MSKLFKETYEKLKKNKENLDNKKPNCIPFEWLPKLRKVLPGIIQGTNWLVTAHSGVKNKLAGCCRYNIFYLYCNQKSYENSKLSLQ